VAVDHLPVEAPQPREQAGLGPIEQDLVDIVLGGSEIGWVELAVVPLADLKERVREDEAGDVARLKRRVLPAPPDRLDAHSLPPAPPNCLQGNDGARTAEIQLGPKPILRSRENPLLRKRFLLETPFFPERAAPCCRSVFAASIESTFRRGNDVDEFQRGGPVR
jgi:hypothetical protein